MSAMSFSFSGRPRRSEHPSSSPAPAARDWAALPRDLLSAVFLRLGPREVMLGAELACTAWRRAAADEPALWRRVGVDWYGWPEPPDRRASVGTTIAMARAALRRSAGRCEAFEGCFGDHDDLLLLVGRTPGLKSLSLYRYGKHKYTEELIMTLKKLPLLEDLVIKLPYEDDPDQSLFGSVCQACPNLKKLSLMFIYPYMPYVIHPTDGGTIQIMCELRFLKLSDCHLSAEGLSMILDNCPSLEHLEISGGFHGVMDNELLMKCAKVKNITLPAACSEEFYDSEEYDFEDGDELLD
ncbi:hypothetical protein ACP4OV_026845 [Aristida adscensionis]